MAGALKDALNEVLASVIGNEARVCVWKYLREYHGVTADDLDTVEKMQQGLAAWRSLWQAWRLPGTWITDAASGRRRKSSARTTPPSFSKSR